MNGASAFLFTLFIYAVAFYILYWVIRLAVRHALDDVRKRQEAAASWAEEKIAENSEE